MPIVPPMRGSKAKGSRAGEAWLAALQSAAAACRRWRRDGDINQAALWLLRARRP